MNSQEFAKLFHPKVKDEIIVWSGEKPVGFSLLREYSGGGNFIPAQNGNGDKDDVALIKVAYYPHEDDESREADLITRVVKFSRYLSKHFDYNFDDPNSPTKESLDISKTSRQPVDLEDVTTFSFNPLTRQFFDKEKKENIDINKIIDDLYDLHIKTTKTFRGALFRVKFYSRENLISLLGFSIKLLEKVNLYLFGKQIKEEKRDFALGLFKPYPHKHLITVYPEKLNLFGTNFHLSKNTIVFFSFVVFLIFFIIYLFNVQITFIDFLLKDNSNNLIYIFSFMVVSIWLLDSLIPHLILVKINSLIRFRSRLIKMKIKIR